MNVPHVRAGWIQAAHSENGLRDSERRAALGADAQRLGRDEIARKLGTSAYLGGSIDRRRGAIQPLAFARGLARAAISAGARLHSGEMVTKQQPSGPRWRVETDRGASVDAGCVLLATNGYTGDLAPVLRRTVIAVNSLQIATRSRPNRWPAICARRSCQTAASP